MTKTDNPSPNVGKRDRGPLPKPTQSRRAPIKDPRRPPESKPATRGERLNDKLLPPIKAMIEHALIEPGGTVFVSGWVVSRVPVEQIAIFVDDRLLGLAKASLPHPDLATAFPTYLNPELGGFLFQQKFAETSLPDRVIRVVVLAAGGLSLELSAPLAIPEQIQPSVLDDRAIRCHCDDARLFEDGTLAVLGWAICTSGVEAVAIDVDDKFVGLAELGRERPDVAHQHASFPNAGQAGFRFERNIVVPFAGEHSLRVTIRGRSGELRMMHRTVQVTPGPASDAALSDTFKLFLDVPLVNDGTATETVCGSLSLVGWAVSKNGIAGLELLIDDVSFGNMHFGSRREDIHLSFPEFPGSLESGFGMLVPPHALRLGRRAIRIIARDKAGGVAERAFSVMVEKAPEGPGPWSLRRKVSKAEVDLDLAILSAAAAAPQFKLLLPFVETDGDCLERLRRSLASLRAQPYGDWRLIILSKTPVAAERLEPHLGALSDKVVLTTDTEVLRAKPPVGQPQLICRLVAGDELGEDALLELALAYAEQPDGDFFYSDERRLDASDGTIKAFFKPDWSPDLLLSTNYIGRLWAVTPALLELSSIELAMLPRLGDYEAALRLTEHAQRIVHVPKVLYTSSEQEPLPKQRQALEDALIRRGIVGEVKDGCLPGVYYVQRNIADEPLVSIIISTMAARGLINKALASIRDRTEYKNYEIICLDNIPAENIAAKKYVKNNSDKVLHISKKFNWSLFNNLGTRSARGQFFLFLNDDIEVVDGEWLTRLIEQAQRLEVGVVGARLLYPDGKVQHAGMFLSHSVARHAFRYLPSSEPGPFGLAATQRNVIGVTGACMLIRRASFDALGGFDEKHAVINNDLDYCLRARRQGQLVVYAPQSTLIHHEMASRANVEEAFDRGRFETAWHQLFLTGDPYFSPHLSVDFDEYRPEAEPFRVLHVGHPLIDRDRIKRILAVKLDHIGDFIAALPALRRLKEHFPKAELWVLAPTASRALVLLEPAIDHVIEFNFFHEISARGMRAVTEDEWNSLQAQLQGLHFDLALDLRQHLETREVLKLAGARWNAGFDYRGAVDWLDVAIEWEGDRARSRKRAHVGDSLLRLVDAVAAACGPDRKAAAAYPAKSKAREAAQALPPCASIAAALFERRVVCVHAGAGAENKRWPVLSFSRLIDLLIDRHGLNAVLVGGRDESEIAEQIFRNTDQKERVFSLVGRVEIAHLPTIVAACDLFVGNDSGPKHLAAMLGVPTIGIHSGTVDAVEWGPSGASAIALRRDMICSPCYLTEVADCQRGLACINGIAVADVYRECRRMLGLSGLKQVEIT